MTILVALGEKRAPETVLRTGYDLAMAYDDDLQVLHVIPETDAQAHFDKLKEIPDFGDLSFSVEENRAREIARKMLREALPDGDRERAGAIGRIGEPTEQILAVSEDLDARYLVVGGRKRSPTGKALFGSVTQSVLLNSSRPVVTVMRDE